MSGKVIIYLSSGVHAIMHKIFHVFLMVVKDSVTQIVRTTNIHRQLLPTALLLYPGRTLEFTTSSEVTPSLALYYLTFLLRDYFINFLFFLW